MGKFRLGSVVRVYFLLGLALRFFLLDLGGGAVFRRFGLPGAAGAGALDDGVDLAADEEGEAGDVKPEQKDHDGAERAIAGAVAVEEMQVSAQGEGNRDPEQ